MRTMPGPKGKSQKLGGSKDTESKKKDEPKLVQRAPIQPHSYRPFIATDPEQVQKLNELNVWPRNIEMHEWIDEVPYRNNREDRPFSTIGRDGFRSKNGEYT
jgi:hypothetical protein